MTISGGETIPLIRSRGYIRAVQQFAEYFLRADDKVLARKKLDQAASINEKQRNLWSQNGYLAALSQSFDVAAADYERELKQYPDETYVYAGLIDAQGRSGKKTEERESLLAYAKAEPKKDSVALFVGWRLLATGNVDEAVVVYRSAAKAIPENKIIQVELASALLRAGKPDEAVSIAKDALDGSSNPGVLNDGAYVLVSRKAELPLAESSSRKGVDLLETESAKTVLDGVNSASFRRVNLLLASWDTLGWIYFAEGKTDLAEQYIRAAWKSDPRAEVGLHLGEILEKQGDQVHAMQIYEMAVSGGRGNPATPAVDELHGRVDALRKQGVKSRYPHPDSVIQEQRTFHIPRPENTKDQQLSLCRSPLQEPKRWSLSVGTRPFAAKARFLLISISDSRFLRTLTPFCYAAEFSFVRHSRPVNLSLHRLRQQT
jgi:tetratricopeptide (TPR) repeat protein